MKKVLLYSGGMDSWLIDKLWKPDCVLFFDIGTENNRREKQKVLATRPDIIIIPFPLSEFEQKEKNFFLPLRNLHFVTYAAHYGDTICLGATGSSTHKDKNETFATLSENVINYLLSEDDTRTENIKIVLPYKDTTKTQLLAMYLEQGGDIEKCYQETFSCYSPNLDNTPCMKCTSCLSKFVAFYNNGYHFTQQQIEQFIAGALSNPNTKGEALALANKLKYGNNTICIDFDKTITDDTPYPNTGKLREGVKETLEGYKRSGYKLVLFTSRVGKDFDEAIKLCKEWKLPFDEYLNGKPYAKYYIDDKALNKFKGGI